MYSNVWHSALNVIGCDQMHYGWMHRDALHVVNNVCNVPGWPFHGHIVE